MTTWIALFRGINVGGNHILPMPALRTALERAGFRQVRSYIQSGNVVFQSARGTADSLAERIGRLVLESHGFQPRLFLLSVNDLRRAMASNPFPAAVAEPKTLHLFFLAQSPRKADVESLHRLKSATESFALRGKVLYLHTPEGIGVSRLAAAAPRRLRVDATARNWRTVGRLLELAVD